MAITNGNIHHDLQNLDKIKFTRILMDDTDKKITFVEARVENSEDPAVLIIEKLPWTEDDVKGVLSKETSAVQQFNNDIYGQYSIQPPPVNNSVKLNLIHPATEKHIEKYLSSPEHLIQETPELYQTVTLPHLQSQQFSLQWVYNVLEHKKEVDRIIFEDPDTDVGFILAQDSKWSGKSVSDLHCLAIVHKRGIKSLRDLNQSHLPLLRNIQKECTQAIVDKYGLSPSQVRMYFHYQPSYYHLHVHVTPPGRIFRSRQNLLEKVISNIEQDPCYYSKTTLSFVVREKDKLYQKFKDIGYFETDKPMINWFDREFESPSQSCSSTREFLEMLGQAKHEPCGEFWETTYGESAWRMCVIALSLCNGGKI